MSWAAVGGRPFRKTTFVRLLVVLVTSVLFGTNMYIGFHDKSVITNQKIDLNGYDLPQRQPKQQINDYRQATNTYKSTILQLPPFTAQESFGACALVLNQNHRITEWIAYHYFALPLRTLIIAYDPKSTQRATQLLQRWRKVIDIIEWEEKDYLPANWSDGIRRQPSWAKPVESVIYENRQVYFMQECTLALAVKNVSRVIHHDVDEYLRLNTDIVKGYDTTRPGHIAEFLNQENNTNIASGWSPNSSCWVFLRLLFTPLIEDSLTERQSNYASMIQSFPWLQPIHFDTLRYRYRNARVQQTGKGILQLHHIPSTLLYRRENFLDKWMKVHYPLGKAICQGPWPIATSPLLLNHYTGSYEAYRYAAQWDPRFQDRTEWERRTAKGKRGVPRIDDVITHWVHAFVAWQSEPVARQLLSDAGWRDG